jgi:hypothetical protein
MKTYNNDVQACNLKLTKNSFEKIKNRMAAKEFINLTTIVISKTYYIK